MNVTQRDLEKFHLHLESWKGCAINFNAYHDDHDRLILRLAQPGKEKESVGMSLFYCTYIAGPTSWSDGDLSAALCRQEDGSVGIEVRDLRAGFVARCASLSLYGEPELIIPES
jgi:hypothetical protein